MQCATLPSHRQVVGIHGKGALKGALPCLANFGACLAVWLHVSTPRPDLGTPPEKVGGNGQKSDKK